MFLSYDSMSMTSLLKSNAFLNRIIKLGLSQLSNFASHFWSKVNLFRPMSENSFQKTHSVSSWHLLLTDIRN